MSVFMKKKGQAYLSDNQDTWLVNSKKDLRWRKTESYRKKASFNGDKILLSFSIRLTWKDKKQSKKDLFNTGLSYPICISDPKLCPLSGCVCPSDRKPSGADSMPWKILRKCFPPNTGEGENIKREFRRTEAKVRWAKDRKHWQCN